MSQTLQIEMPDDVFAALQKEPQALAEELRLAAAVKWYELGVLSQEKAAAVAGLSRAEFVFALRRFKVAALQETAEEILAAAKP